MKIVIRAGGVGARLWPLSRRDQPKQFQTVVGEQTMLRTTYERLRALVAPGDLFVSVNQKLLDKLRQELPEIEASNIIVESEARNTGPAMCLESCWLERRFGPAATVASLPSDDYISQPAALGDLLRLSADFIKTHPDYLLTPAVRPVWPDSGYSYFKVGANLAQAGEEAIYEVADVAEKPNEEYCHELLASGVYYCHTGMYVWRLGRIIALWQELQPAMYEVCQKIVDLTEKNLSAEAAALYAGLEKMTIETAITGRAPQVAMSVSNRIGWSDLGKWHIIKKVLLSDEKTNLIKGLVVANEAKNNLLYNFNDKKVMVVNDVDGLVVVDTPDALFISSAKKSAEVKKCLEKLKEEGWEEFL